MKAQTISLLSILMLLPATVSSADKAFTWTDANGTRHYSEEPPFDRDISAVEIELLPAPSAGNIGAEDDFYSVINQANRMERNRLENEHLASEKLQVEIDLKQAAEEIELRLAPPANAAPKEYTSYNPARADYKATSENTKNQPAYPQNTGHRLPTANYGEPLYAKPGEAGQPPEYAPLNPPGN